MGNGATVSKFLHVEEKSEDLLKKVICLNTNFTILDFIKSVEDWALVKNILVYESGLIMFLVKIKETIRFDNPNINDDESNNNELNNNELHNTTLYFSDRNFGRGILYKNNHKIFTPIAIAQTHTGEFPIGKYAMLRFEPMNFFTKITNNTLGQNLISEIIEESNEELTHSEISKCSDSLENRPEIKIYDTLRNNLYNLTPEEKSKILYAFMKALGKQIKICGISKKSKYYTDFDNEECTLLNYALTDEEFVSYTNPLSYDITG